MSTEDRNYEEEARQQGWKPPEELPEDFKGEPVDAETFVKRGEQFVGFLKPRLDKLERKLQYQEQLNSDFKAQMERERKAKAKEIEVLETQLRENRKQAVVNGDGDAFDEAERKMEELRKYKTEQVQSNVSDVPPEWAVEWQSENDWYGKDVELTTLADNYSAQLKAQNPYLSERAFLDNISEFIKTTKPEKFNRKPKQAVEEPGTKRSNDEPNEGTSNAKKYSNLPADAKRECDRLMKEGVIKDKNQYAEIYFAD